jgi:putative addiction module component (TIGR02574 family)
MTDSKQTLCNDAKRLPPAERLALVEELLDSLDQADPAIDALWAQEAEDRLAAYRLGEIRAIPLTEVLAYHQRG